MNTYLISSFNQSPQDHYFQESGGIYIPRLRDLSLNSSQIQNILMLSLASC